MKKAIYFIVFLFIGFTGFSQTDGSAYHDKARKLIELTSAGQFDVLIGPLVNMVPEANREAFKADVKTSMNELYEKLTVIYMENYSEEEVDAILAFYNTPVGKKMVAVTPEITQKSMQIGQQWGMQLQPLMAKYSK